jgi:putative tricarboxylic transport membrane protein
LYFIIIPWQIPSVEAKGILMSSSFYPKIGTGLLAFFSILLILNDILRVKSDIGSQKTKPELKQRLNLFAGIFLCFTYTFLMNPMGFLLSTFLLLISLMFLMGQRNFKFILPLAASFNILIYYVFAKILQIPLPKGLLFR